MLSHLVNDYLEMRKQHFDTLTAPSFQLSSTPIVSELNRATEQLEQLKQEGNITDLDAQMLRLLDEKAQLVKGRGQGIRRHPGAYCANRFVARSLGRDREVCAA